MAKEYEFHKAAHPPADNEGKIVFSKDGFLEVGGKWQISNYITHEDFINIGVNKIIFADNPFFWKFLKLKIFFKWKVHTWK